MESGKTTENKDLETNTYEVTHKATDVLMSMLQHVNKNFQLSELGESTEMCNYVTMAQVLSTTIKYLESDDTTVYELNMD